MRRAWRLKDGCEWTCYIGVNNDIEYPILPGDELHKKEDGTFTKIAPGLCITGLAISESVLEEYDEHREWIIG